MAKKTLPEGRGTMLWKGKHYAPGAEVPEDFPEDKLKDPEEIPVKKPQGSDRPGSSNSGVELDEEHQVPTPVRTGDEEPARRRKRGE